MRVEHCVIWNFSNGIGLPIMVKMVFLSIDTCPEHSKCTNNGPGSFLCRCDAGWGGYKCLHKTDRNVTIPITTSVAGVTVLLSAVLWYTQRRHVL